jgi:hypothetical protein
MKRPCSSRVVERARAAAAHFDGALSSAAPTAGDESNHHRDRDVKRFAASCRRLRLAPIPGRGQNREEAGYFLTA